MTTFPEDIECVYQPLNGKGAIYVSNIEAASNPQTLASNQLITKNMESEQSSLPSKERT